MGTNHFLRDGVSSFVVIRDECAFAILSTRETIFPASRIKAISCAVLQRIIEQVPEHFTNISKHLFHFLFAVNVAQIAFCS
ncbi:hypothetical protein F6Y04_00285 [Bacillus megaterium]|nr:hypothetical protein [Priestia megaterium]